MALQREPVNATLSWLDHEWPSCWPVPGIAKFSWRRHTSPMTANSGEHDSREGVRSTTQEQRDDIPADTFSVRLVLSRHHAGRLSIEQAAIRCGLNAEGWRRWEDGARPRDQIQVCQAVSEGLRIDLNWLMFGGPLSSPRGRPTKRPSLNTDEYVSRSVQPSAHSTVRPTGGRPKVRTDSRGSNQPLAAGRRAALVR